MKAIKQAAKQAAKPVVKATVKTTAKPAVAAKPTAKPSKTAKPVVKIAAKAVAAKKPTLTPEQRSAIARLAAYKAHTHKTFQEERTASEAKLAREVFARAQRDASKNPKLFASEDYDAREALEN